MKPQFRQLPGLLDRYNVAPQDRSYLVGIAVSRTIAYGLAIPTSPVDSPMTYFLEQYSEEMYDTLNDVNEMLVINTELAVSLIKKLWLLRYNTVHSMSNPAAQSVIDGCIAGPSSEVPPSVSQLYVKYEGRGLFQAVNDLLTTRSETVGEGVARMVPA